MKGLHPEYLKPGKKTDASPIGKSERRFKFQGLAARLEAVDIDVHHTLAAHDAAEWRTEVDVRDNAPPFSLSTIERWVELNCTADFNAFRRELSPMLLSVPLILHRRAAIFDLLCSHLTKASTMALKPVLETTAALAVDLRQEFYPEFPRVLKCLASLLRPEDPEMLEDVFTTLCYLFKYLLRQLLADLPGAFASYRPLLAHDKPHVRDFAAESFSYLLRRLPSGSVSGAVRRTVLHHAGVDAALDEGISCLLFHVAKGPGHRLHSRTPLLLEALVVSLASRVSTRVTVESGGARASAQRAQRRAEARFAVARETLRRIGEHTRREHAEPVWTTLASGLRRALVAWARQVAPQSLLATSHAAGGADGDGDTGASDADGHDDDGDGDDDDDGDAEEGGGAADAGVGNRVDAAALQTGHRESQHAGVTEASGADAAAADEASAAAHVRFLARLVNDWVGLWRGSRLPAGALPQLVQVLNRAFSSALLPHLLASVGTLSELLSLLSVSLVSSAHKGCATPLDEAALAPVASKLLARLFSHASVEQTADDAVAAKSRESIAKGRVRRSKVHDLQDKSQTPLAPRSPPPHCLFFEFGLALLPWRHATRLVLPHLLSACESCVGDAPNDVLSVLLAIALHDAHAHTPLRVPPQCMHMLVAKLRAPDTTSPDITAATAATTTTTTTADVAAADGRAAAESFAALRVLRSVEKSAADELRPQLTLALGVLLAPLSSARNVERAWPERVVLQAAALEALAHLDLTAPADGDSDGDGNGDGDGDGDGGSNGGGGDAAASLAVKLVTAALSASEETGQDYALVAPLLQASVHVLRNATCACGAPRAIDSCVSALLRCCSHSAAEVRTAALESLDAMSALHWVHAPNWTDAGRAQAAAEAEAVAQVGKVAKGEQRTEEEPGVSEAATPSTTGDRSKKGRDKKVKKKMSGPVPVAGASIIPSSSSSPSDAIPSVDLRRVLSLCLAVEASVSSPTSKQLVVDVEELGAAAGHPRLPSLLRQLLCHHVVGMLRIKFARVWPLVTPLMQTLCRADRAELWPRIVEALAEVHRMGRGGVDGGVDGVPTAGDKAPLDEGEGDAGEADGEAADVVIVDGQADARLDEQHAGSSELGECWLPTAAVLDLRAEIESAWEDALVPARGGVADGPFCVQLLKALSSAPLLSLAVSRSVQLMPFWRKVAAQATGNARALETGAVDTSGGGGGSVNGVGHDDAHADGAGHGGGHGVGDGFAVCVEARLPLKSLLSAWLGLWCAVEAPGKLHDSARLYADCMQLLCHSDEHVQALAVDVLARWQQAALTAHRSQLLSLIRGKTFRETLAMFSVDKSSGTLQAEHRALLLLILTRLLFARLTIRVGRGASKNSMAARRATIFAFFSGFASHELRELFDLIVGPISAVGACTFDGIADPAADARRAAAVARVPATQQLGVVRSLHECIQQIGVELQAYLPEAMAALMHLLRLATHCVCHTSEGSKEEAAFLLDDARIDAPMALTLQQARELRLWCIKTFGLILRIFPNANFEHYMPMFWSCVAPVLRRLHSHYSQSPAGLLELIGALMSQRATLPLLSLSPTPVLPCAFGCFSAPNVSTSVMDCVLSIAEALVKHCGDATKPNASNDKKTARDGEDDGDSHGDNDGDSEGDGDGDEDGKDAIDGDDDRDVDMDAEGKALLLAHVPQLLSQLHARLKSKFGGSDAAKALAAAGAGSAATRELRLLVSLAPYVENGEQAKQMIELFLPYLRLKHTARTERVKAQALSLIRQLIGMTPQPLAHAHFFALLFGQLRSRHARHELCLLWAALPDAIAAAPAISPADRERHAELTELATELIELNAFEETSIDECDYGRRLDAYGRIPPLLSRLSPPTCLPLLCHCLFDVELDDIALRHVASHTVKLIIRRAAVNAGPSRDARKHAQANADARTDAPAADAASTAAMEWEAMLSRVLMPAVRHGLRLPTEKDLVRAELTSLLAAALLEAPWLQPELATLLSPRDAEADFFYNMTHVQLPRRQRALARLRVKVDAAVFSPTTLSNYLLPMVRHMVLRNTAKEADVAEEAVITLKSIAAQLPWRPYHAALGSFIRLLKVQPELERRLVRAMVAVLDVFHFDIADEVAPAVERAVAEAGQHGRAATAAAAAAAAAKQGGGAAEQVAAAVAAAAATADSAAASADKANAKKGRAGRKRNAGAKREEIASEETKGEEEGEPKDQEADDVKEGDDDQGDEDQGDDDQGDEDQGDDDQGEDDQGHDAARGDGGDDDDDDEDDEAEGDGAEDAAADGDALLRSLAIRKTVREKLLPQLYSHMKDPKTEGMRVPVALVVLKLLMVMPPSVLEVELRGFIMRLVTTLSSRDKAVRLLGRQTLAKVVVELGPTYFGNVVHEMRTSLTKGFQLHVLGYSLHTLLSKLVPTLSPGALDHCVPLIVQMLMSDVFGEAAEKKEVDAIANSMLEAKSTQSFASFELLASVVAFVPNVNLLVPPVHAAVLSAPGGAESLKNVARARELYRRAVIGLCNNSSTDLQPLCVYVQGMLKTHLPKTPPTAKGGTTTANNNNSNANAAAATSAASNGKKRGHGVAPVGSVLQPTHEPSVSGSVGVSPLSSELLAFALGLFLSMLRKGRFLTADSTHAGLLEPLLPLLQRALRCDSDAVVSSALRVLSCLLAFPLPSLPANSTALLDRTLALLKRSASVRGVSEIVGISIKVVTALLRKPPKLGGADAASAPVAGPAASPIATASEANRVDGGDDDSDDDMGSADATALLNLAASASARAKPLVGGGARLGETQLRWLLSFVSVHLDDATLQSSLFALLRVVLSRRFVLAELYDLVLVIGDMVLQADSHTVRASCSTLYLSFLLNYPLGPKRLQQHLNFIVTNLGYPVTQGRLSLLQLLHAMLTKLPLELLHEQSDRLLIPLVARLVSEEETACSAAVAAAVKVLLSRTCATSGGGAAASARESVLKLLGVWFGDSTQPALCRAASQLIELLVDALGTDAGVASATLPLVVESCVREADAGPLELQSEQQADAEDGVRSGVQSVVQSGMQAGSQAERWQPAFFCLKALNRMCAQQPSLLRSDACSPLWSRARLLLLHDHAWVRSAFGRCLGQLLATVTPDQLVTSADAVRASGRQVSRTGQKEPKNDVVIAFLGERGALLRLTDAVVQQLHSPVIAEAAADQALKTLLWLVLTMLKQPALAPLDCAADLDAAKKQLGRGKAVRGEKPKPSAASAAARERLVETGVGESPAWFLQVISARLAPLMQSTGFVRGSASIKWYAAVISQLDPPVLEQWMPVLLPPVVLAAEDKSGKVHPAVRDKASEVLTLSRSRVDPMAFAAEYQQVKERQRKAARERKEKASAEAVVNPELAAQKRIAKNLGKRQGKVRKIERMKRSREANGSLGVGKKRRRA